MNNADYIKNTIQFLHENNIVKLKKDPTQIFNQQIKNVINAANYLLSNDRKENKIIKPFAPVLT